VREKHEISGTGQFLAILVRSWFILSVLYLGSMQFCSFEMRCSSFFEFILLSDRTSLVSFAEHPSFDEILGVVIGD
jgi:hypothetical protein